MVTQDSAAVCEREADRMAVQLRDAGLRPTRQRLDLWRVLFSKGHRHVSAEDLHDEAERAGVRISLATVYNALHQFTRAGLINEVVIDGARTYFDTNVGDHHHFFVEGEGRLIDMQHDVGLTDIPAPPEGTEIVAGEVVARVRRKQA